MANALLRVYPFLFGSVTLTSVCFPLSWQIIAALFLFQDDRREASLAKVFQFIFYVPALSFFSFAGLVAQFCPPLRIFIAWLF